MKYLKSCLSFLGIIVISLVIFYFFIASIVVPQKRIDNQTVEKLYAGLHYLKQYHEQYGEFPDQKTFDSTTYFRDQPRPYEITYQYKNLDDFSVQYSLSRLSSDKLGACRKTVIGFGTIILCFIGNEPDSFAKWEDVFSKIN